MRPVIAEIASYNSSSTDGLAGSPAAHSPSPGSSSPCYLQDPGDPLGWSHKTVMLAASGAAVASILLFAIALTVLFFRHRVRRDEQPDPGGTTGDTTGDQLKGPAENPTPCIRQEHGVLVTMPDDEVTVAIELRPDAPATADVDPEDSATSDVSCK